MNTQEKDIWFEEEASDNYRAPGLSRSSDDVSPSTRELLSLLDAIGAIA
mgnify:CR=1 FL=1